MQCETGGDLRGQQWRGQEVEVEDEESSCACFVVSIYPFHFFFPIRKIFGHTNGCCKY
uniref:Uncharacterized protein n=1 Tax=Arundo donax TaxID=35708 RepID=A0A0A9ECW7_ARUDO